MLYVLYVLYVCAPWTVPPQQGCIEEVVLHDCWADTDAQPGDTVNVIADAAHAGQLHVGMGRGLLVLHPDVLLSGSGGKNHLTMVLRVANDARPQQARVCRPALTASELLCWRSGWVGTATPRQWRAHCSTNCSRWVHTKASHACG